MHCVKPITLLNINPPDGLQVPCGKCIACRISKRRELSLRMTHELQYHEDSVFVTLTYDEDHIPEHRSLRKADLQKFLKRLRRDIEPKKVRYFACGEYGDQTQRPHYHLILFGISIKKSDKQLISDNWQKGLCHFGLVEPDSIQYVAGYIDKKYSGELAEIEYTQKNREPVFRLMSQGIGKKYCDENEEQIITMEHCTLRGVPMSIPRYYIKRAGIDSKKFGVKAIENELELVKSLTGEEKTINELYRTDVKSFRYVNDKIKMSKKQHEKNLIAKSQLKQKKL